MKHRSLRNTSWAGAGIAALLVLSGCSNEKQESSPEIDGLTTMHQKVTYINSYNMVKKGVANGVVFDVSVLERAVYDGTNGLPPLVPKSEQMGVMTQLKKEFEVRRVEERAQLTESNIKNGPEFLAQNALKPGVNVTESGLQYRVITSVDTDEPSPGPEDMVKVHYRGTLIDGKVFDASIGKGKPLNLRLDQVISGWTEGIQMMKIGEKYEFVIPSQLAYGEEGTRGNIAGNAVLVFEVELFEINPDVEAEKKASKLERRAKIAARAAKRRAQKAAK